MDAHKRWTFRETCASDHSLQRHFIRKIQNFDDLRAVNAHTCKGEIWRKRGTLLPVKFHVFIGRMYLPCDAKFAFLGKYVQQYRDSAMWTVLPVIVSDFVVGTGYPDPVQKFLTRLQIRVIRPTIRFSTDFGLFIASIYDVKQYCSSSVLSTSRRRALVSETTNIILWCDASTPQAVVFVTYFRNLDLLRSDGNWNRVWLPGTKFLNRVMLQITSRPNSSYEYGVRVKDGVCAVQALCSKH